MSRITRDEYFLRMAGLVSMRSTCSRRHTGCVLIDAKNHVLATGFNGVPAGFEHCAEGWRCTAALAKPGECLDGCLAIHAEQNALLQCRNTNEIETCYCVDSPCVHCVKLLLNTSCRRVVFARPYPHPEAMGLWLRGGRTWSPLKLKWPFVMQEPHYRKEK